MNKTERIKINKIDHIVRSAYLLTTQSAIFQLDKTSMTIGRGENNDIDLEDPFISRVHGQIRLVQDQYIYIDLGSSGGSRVNGKQVIQQTLHNGDVLLLGKTALIFGQDDIDEEGTSPVTIT